MACRPSAIYGVEAEHGKYAAYCFDSAVIAWGSAFDNALQEAGSNAKTAQAGQAAQGRVLRRWVGAGPGSYRDPATG